MAHTFLLQPGRWTMEGNWLERDGMPISVKGMTLVAWSRDNWFTMATKLIFPGSDRAEISLQYKGRLDKEERQYSFLLQHNLLGKIEGEGWIGIDTIVQHYWVLGDRQRRSGFETMHRISEKAYYLSSGVMTGHVLTNTMEVSLERQAT
ncbi:hypothetical protein [Nodularia sphaerocarpa]|uniref:hypothetical protein n=1 Tax=Nodularia sphaerocarpa TaxID=137816 RepID=UPI001EFAD8BA|nr:hypothetical protein [Nodularia sphaerocarpa]MDB9373819.1 hypothetical protein [Nodularia sphaerocarpa CS-585]MDB9380429.1 hypothetical protein [Nodularia sphaerocarpa CS-585A2]ULP72872.1 hypothetical protein BDGGKGIB_02523 [Nodularia sphaerocarpa UHCC 0038]